MFLPGIPDHERHSQGLVIELILTRRPHRSLVRTLSSLTYQQDMFKATYRKQIHAMRPPSIPGYQHGHIKLAWKLRALGNHVSRRSFAISML